MSTRHKATRSAHVASYFCFGLGMIFIIAINIFIYSWMRRQSERWLPR